MARNEATRVLHTCNCVGGWGGKQAWMQARNISQSSIYGGNYVSERSKKKKKGKAIVPLGDVERQSGSPVLLYPAQLVLPAAADV